MATSQAALRYDEQLFIAMTKSCISKLLVQKIPKDRKKQSTPFQRLWNAVCISVIRNE
jgi:hypothetical protein